MKKVWLIIFSVLFWVATICTIVFSVLWSKNQQQIDNDPNIAIVVELRAEVKSLQEEIQELINNNNSISAELTQAKNDITRVETEKQNLINEKSVLQEQLQSSEANKEELLTQIETKQNAIDTLNSEKEGLLARVASLESQLSEKQNNITLLNARVAELETQLAGYMENYEPVDTDKFAVVTFEYKNEFYGAQLVQKGSYISMQEPVSTDRITFNYWELNGVEFNLNTQPITQNCMLVANVSTKYEVKFINGETILNTQLVNENGFANYSETPQKVGYVFDYYTLNGVDEVNVSTYPITQDTTFIAHFTKQETWNIFYEGNFVVLSGDSYNQNVTKTLDIPEIKTGDNFRVTFSVAEVFDGEDSAEPTYYYCFKDGRYKWCVDYEINRDGWVKCALVLEKGEYTSFFSNSFGTCGLSIKCLTDGTITIKTIDDSSIWLGFKNLTISKVEIFK